MFRTDFELSLRSRLSGFQRLVRGEPPRARFPREPDFWRLWFCGFSIYAIRWIELIVVAIFVYQRTESAFWVAAVSMMRSVPMALFGAPFGVMADRFDRRLCLILVVSVMLTTSIVMAALAYADALQVWHLAVGSFINGLGWTSDNPTRRIMIGEVLGADRLGAGMSIDIGTNNFTRVVGPIVGGAIFAKIGIFGVFATLTGLYVVALVAACSVRYRNKPARQTSSDGVLTHLFEDFRSIRGNYTVRAVLLITVIFNLFGLPLFSVVPVIAQDHLRLGPAEIGVLVSAEGAGAFVGAAAMGFLATQARHGMILVTGCASYPAMLMLFALASNPHLAAVFLFVPGIGVAAFSITQITLLYAVASTEMRGRVLGLLSTFIGISPIGFIHVGMLSDAIGARAAILIIGCEGILAIGLTWRYWRYIDQPGRPPSAHATGARTG